MEKDAFFVLDTDKRLVDDTCISVIKDISLDDDASVVKRLVGQYFPNLGHEDTVVPPNGFPWDTKYTMKFVGKKEKDANSFLLVSFGEKKLTANYHFKPRSESISYELNAFREIFNCDKVENTPSWYYDVKKVLDREENRKVFDGIVKKKVDALKRFGVPSFGFGRFYKDVKLEIETKLFDSMQGKEETLGYGAMYSHCGYSDADRFLPNMCVAELAKNGLFVMAGKYDANILDSPNDFYITAPTKENSYSLSFPAGKTIVGEGFFGFSEGKDIYFLPSARVSRAHMKEGVAESYDVCLLRNSDVLHYACEPSISVVMNGLERKPTMRAENFVLLLKECGLYKESMETDRKRAMVSKAELEWLNDLRDRNKEGLLEGITNVIVPKNDEALLIVELDTFERLPKGGKVSYRSYGPQSALFGEKTVELDGVKFLAYMTKAEREKEIEMEKGGKESVYAMSEGMVSYFADMGRAFKGMDSHVASIRFSKDGLFRKNTYLQVMLPREDIPVGKAVFQNTEMSSVPKRKSYVRDGIDFFNFLTENEYKEEYAKKTALKNTDKAMDESKGR